MAPTVVAFLDSYNGVRPKSEEKRTMLNKLILFCTFAIFMLAVGGVVTPLQAHCKGKHSAPHEHCIDLPPAESYPLYDVLIDGGWDPDIPGPVISGSILPGEGWDWIWNGRQVGSTYAQGRTFPLEMTNISPFVGNLLYDDSEPPVIIGYECFDNLVTFGGFFRKHKKNTANGLLWFPGTTSDGLDDVLYLLKIDGHFDDDTSGDGFPGNDKIMHMTDWELKVENAGADVASRSCEGSGTFGGNVVTVTFEEIIEEQ
jgi:hypothetical protein